MQIVFEALEETQHGEDGEVLSQPAIPDGGGGAMDPYPWQVEVFWDDGSGGMCAIVSNGCS